MGIDEIRMMGAALSPLSVFLFACEMSSMQDLYNKSLISDNGMSRRVLLYVLKLPVSIVLPVLAAWYGLAALALADAASVLNIFRERRKFVKYMKSKGEWD